ncbi:hypothetical protein E2C01_090652 [Portunus trituberculatus]|uniref:Uncharacterized protein n=1 Tax=Portunus trituberculatus TaxID=210409 RepID=A0A5B7JKQ9_PORTR|nr:hypothetical protein [Portunus trituberculatus]
MPAASCLPHDAYLLMAIVPCGRPFRVPWRHPDSAFLYLPIPPNEPRSLSITGPEKFTLQHMTIQTLLASRSHVASLEPRLPALYLPINARLIVPPHLALPQSASACPA